MQCDDEPVRTTAGRGVVVLITCGASQCTTQDDAVALAQIVWTHLKQLVPTTTGGGGKK